MSEDFERRNPEAIDVSIPTTPSNFLGGGSNDSIIMNILSGLAGAIISGGWLNPVSMKETAVSFATGVTRG